MNILHSSHIPSALSCLCYLCCAVCLVEGASVAKDPVPGGLIKSQYVKISFSYMGAMFASNAALSYVNYPTQVHFLP